MLTLFMRDLFREVDYSLLLTFVFFFIFCGQQGKIGGVNALLSALMDKHALPTCVLASPGRQQRARRRPSFGLFTELARPADGHEPWRPRPRPLPSLASLISLKLYARSAPGGTRRYLLVFSASMLAALALLYALAAAG